MQHATWVHARHRSLQLAGACLLVALVALPTVRAASPPFPVIGKPAPDFALLDQAERTVQVSQFRGKLVLLDFIYTNCTDVCPLTTAALARVQRELIARGWWATEVVFLTVTTDPLHDTPAVLRAYAGRFKADLRAWRFLTGDPRAAASVYKRYGIEVYPMSGGLQDHSSPTFVIGRTGVVLGVYGINPDPAAILHDLAQLRQRGG